MEIKEGKAALRRPRLSCRAFRANAVRLQLFALTYNLANFLRTLRGGGAAGLVRRDLAPDQPAQAKTTAARGMRTGSDEHDDHPTGEARPLIAENG